jgi:hypothetical protein
MCPSLPRIEELPSGKRVLYIDATTLPTDSAAAVNCLERMARSLGRDEKENGYVVAVQPNKCSCTLKFDLEYKLLIASIVMNVIVFCVTLYELLLTMG